MKYVEGQTVRVVSDRSSHGIADGTKVKITQVFQSPLHYGIRVEGGLTRYAREDELEGHAVALRKFKAGDKVFLNTTKPIRGSGSLPLSEGDVEGVVTGYDERDNDVIVSFPDHPRFYAVESELTKVGEAVEVEVKEPEQLVVGDVVRIVTSHWAPEAPMNSLATLVADGSVRGYFCNKGVCEVSFAQRNLGEKIEKVASAGEAIVGAVYRVLGNECRPRHNYAVGQLIRCTGVAKDDSGSDFVALHDSLRQYVHQSQLEFVAFTAEGLEEVVEAPTPVVEATPAALKVGDKVRLIVRSPFYGTGEVKFHDVGTVKRISDSGVIYVDFPAQRNWMAKPSELELASVPVKASEPRADRTQAPVYVVVHEERQEDFLIVTEDREEARRVKTRKGGKRAGYIINLYAKVKEIR